MIDKDYVRYSDLDMSFKINPNTRDLVTKIDKESIKQHIRLLFIDNGLLFKPESRNGISIELFDSWDSHTKYIVDKRIRDHIQVYEPRITIDDLRIDFNPEEQTLAINMIYTFESEREDLNFRFLVSSVR